MRNHLSVNALNPFQVSGAIKLYSFMTFIKVKEGPSLFLITKHSSSPSLHSCHVPPR